MKADAIVGYTYNADVYCPRHIMIATGHAAERCADPEGVLNMLAEGRGIDRMDERSFDSGDFPKVIFAVQACDEEHDTCGACGVDLMGHERERSFEPDPDEMPPMGPQGIDAGPAW